MGRDQLLQCSLRHSDCKRHRFALCVAPQLMIAVWVNFVNTTSTSAGIHEINTHLVNLQGHQTPGPHSTCHSFCLRFVRACTLNAQHRGSAASALLLHPHMTMKVRSLYCLCLGARKPSSAACHFDAHLLVTRPPHLVGTCSHSLDMHYTSLNHTSLSRGHHALASMAGLFAACQLSAVSWRSAKSQDHCSSNVPLVYCPT